MPRLEDLNTSNYELDIVKLDGQDDYAKYFNHILFAFNCLAKHYSNVAKKNKKEADRIFSYLSRFLKTIEMLRWKYLYSQNKRMRVDISASGFFNRLELLDIVSDTEHLAKAKAKTASLKVLKSALADYIMKHGEDSPDLLEDLAHARYLQELDNSNFFMPFTPGQLVLEEEKDEVRRYTFSWAIFDSLLNRPFVYIMMFEQSIGQEPLHENDQEVEKFCAGLENRCRGTSELAEVAEQIDIAFTDLHPKVLKRICLGPLYSQLITRLMGETEDEKEMAVKSLLENHSSADSDDVIFFFDDEVILSSSERKIASLFGKQRLQQVFFVAETDMECFKRKVSQLTKRIVMPHRILQALTPSEKEFFCGYRVLSYDSEGRLYHEQEMPSH